MDAIENLYSVFMVNLIYFFNQKVVLAQNNLKENQLK